MKGPSLRPPTRLDQMAFKVSLLVASLAATAASKLPNLVFILAGQRKGKGA